MLKVLDKLIYRTETQITTTRCTLADDQYIDIEEIGLSKEVLELCSPRFHSSGFYVRLRKYTENAQLSIDFQELIDRCIARSYVAPREWTLKRTAEFYKLVDVVEQFRGFEHTMWGHAFARSTVQSMKSMVAGISGLPNLRERDVARRQEVESAVARHNTLGKQVLNDYFNLVERTACNTETKREEIKVRRRPVNRFRRIFIWADEPENRGYQWFMGLPILWVWFIYWVISLFTN